MIWEGELMRTRTFIRGRGPGITLIGTVLTLALLVVSFGACTRPNSTAVRFASTDNPSLNNGPINNPPTNAAPRTPGISTADVVGKVAPPDVTLHSQIQVRQPRPPPSTHAPSS